MERWLESPGGLGITMLSSVLILGLFLWALGGPAGLIAFSLSLGLICYGGGRLLAHNLKAQGFGSGFSWEVLGLLGGLLGFLVAVFLFLRFVLQPFWH